MTLALEAAHDASTHDRGCTEVGRRPLVTMDEQESGAHSPGESGAQRAHQSTNRGHL